MRDVKAIRAIFHGGIAPLDRRGRARVMASDVPIASGDIPVSSGGRLFGDADRVVVIPQAAEEQLLRVAFKNVAGERNILRALQRGDSLQAVFTRYDIL